MRAPLDAARLGLAGALAVAGLAVFAAQPWHGATLLTLSVNHGVDSGDIVVLPLVAPAVGVGIGLLRRRRARAEPATTPFLVVGAVLGVGGLLSMAADASTMSVPVDRGLAIAFVVALTHAVWVGPVRASDLRGPWRVLQPLPLVLLLAGFAIDAALAPTGTVFGPILLAAYAAATARDRSISLALGAVVTAGLALTVASIVDAAGVGTAMADTDGAAARSTVLGLVLVLVGREGVEPSHDGL